MNEEEKEINEFIDEEFDAFFQILITDIDKAMDIITPMKLRCSSRVKKELSAGFTKKDQKTRKTKFEFYKKPRRLQKHKNPNIQKMAGIEISRRIRKTIYAWSLNEDRILQNAVRKDFEKLNNNDIQFKGLARWNYYSRVVFKGTRSPKECKNRWMHSLNPLPVNKGEWTYEEKITLLESIIESDEIGNLFPYKKAALDMDYRRTEVSCRTKFEGMRYAVAERFHTSMANVTPQMMLRMLKEQGPPPPKKPRLFRRLRK
jgi:hypothetical protein